MLVPEVLQVNQVLAQGNDRIIPPNVNTVQLFQWQTRTRTAKNVVLALRATLNGIAFEGSAGSPGGITGRVEVQYGAGNVFHRVYMDLSNGCYQLPPCDHVSCDVFVTTALASDPIDLTATLVEGLYPGARPPTWSIRNFAALGVPYTFDAPPLAKAYTVSLQPYPPAAIVFPPPNNAQVWELLASAPALTMQRDYWSLDGAANYPSYSPVNIGIANYDPPRQWRVTSFNASTAFNATFFLAL